MSDRLGGIKPAVLLLVGLLWSVGTASATGVQDSPASSATSTQSIYLEYRELPSGVRIWGIPITFQSAPFKKEPILGQGKVYRGTLKFRDSTEDFLPFILDLAQGRLYLDLNLNTRLPLNTAATWLVPSYRVGLCWSSAPPTPPRWPPAAR